jgi:hypothetical protein
LEAFKLVYWLLSLNACMGQLMIAGPAFDAYGLKPLLIPGCIGLIGSIMVLSVAKGVFHSTSDSTKANCILTAP